MSEQIFTRWIDPTIEEQRKEIERLKEENEYLNIANIEFSKRITDAIEYIKEKAKNNCWIDQYEASDLIKILKGEDKE